MKKILILLGMFLVVFYSIAGGPDDFYFPDPEDKPNYALNIIIIIIVVIILIMSGKKKDDE